MSFALEFSKRATREFSELDVWLQKETIDELDEIALQVDQLETLPSGEMIRDYIRERQNCRHYVFIIYFIIPARRAVRIASIGAFFQTAL